MKTNSTASKAATAKSTSTRRHANKAQQAKIIEQLKAEEDRLSKSIQGIKAMQKDDVKHAGQDQNFTSHLKDADRKMIENYDKFTKRSNAKLIVVSTDVLSKIKR